MLSAISTGRHCKSVSRQRGAALILMAFIIGLAVTAVMIKSFNAASMRAEQDERTAIALAQAKEALIAWSVSHPFTPGLMPYPDRREATSPNYDGRSDCPGGVTLSSHLVGRLPWREADYNNCTYLLNGIGKEFLDGSNEPLWYVVSSNIVHRYSPPSDPVINPETINSGTWLKVRDRSGALISERVAAVIIAPGPPMGTQNRSGVPTANQFLDRLQIGETVYDNSDYDSDFITGTNSSAVTTFNDKLVFITIDELIGALNNRAATEASRLLNQYKAKNGQFPYAANLGSPLNNHISSGANAKGMLPIDVTDSCGCTAVSSCSCSFNPIVSVKFTRNPPDTWLENTGSCIRSGSSCTCSGAGGCAETTNTFSCDVSGLCTHNVTGAYTYSVPSYADIFSQTLGCSIVGNEAVCNGEGSFSIGLKEPSWFKDNFWQDYLYYEWSGTQSLRVGDRFNLDAILIATGARATTEIGWEQNPPSTDIRDYLDSSENTNGDFVFDAANKRQADNYNDRPFIVSPK